MVNMNKGEEAIKEFFQIKKLIEDEESNCITPHVEADENIGGGSAGFISNPTAVKGEKLITSKRLANLREIERVVGLEYACLTGFSKEVIDLYFNNGKGTRKTDKAVKDITQIPVSHLRNIRIDFTILVCRKMGY